MLFKNANIFVGGQFQHGSFRVENGKFAEILTTVPAEDGIDLNNQYVIPGLVDVHNHGNSGADFSDGDYDGLVKMARYLAQNGVTSFAPASMTLPYDVLEAAYKTAVQLKKAQPEGCARLIGIQMEGPFFSEKKKGAQNGAYLRLPDFEAFKRLYDVSEGLIRIADVAAELPGAVGFAEKASKLCTVSIAHTDCTYEEASAVLDAGASHLTHLYNAMPSIHHRKPGPIGAGSERENVIAELICDGQHIHPSAVRCAVEVSRIRTSGRSRGTTSLAAASGRHKKLRSLWLITAARAFTSLRSASEMCRISNSSRAARRSAMRRPVVPEEPSTKILYLAIPNKPLSITAFSS